MNEDKVLKCVEYLLDYDWSMQKIADNMCLAKSTVHKYLTEDIKRIDDDLYVQCKNRLRKHKASQW